MDLRDRIDEDLVQSETQGDRGGALQGPGPVRVHGKVAGRPRTVEFAVNLDEPARSHKALAPVWARAKIASPYHRMAGSNSPRIISMISRDVALRHGLVSDSTAFVAADSITRTAGDHGTTVPVAFPVPKPKGM